MKVFYELRGNGKSIGIFYNYEEALNVYEAYKKLVPSVYYEVYKIER